VAALQFRNGNYRILLRFQGKQFTYPVGQVSEEDAQVALNKVEHWLGRLKARLLTPPPPDQIIEFIQNDGVLPERYQPPAPLFRLSQLRDDYLALHTSVLDVRTIADMKGHWKHLARLLDDKTEAQAVTLPEGEKIHLSAHVLRHTMLRRVAEEHGIQYAIELSGHTSSQYIWRYVKPTDEQKEKALEDLF
jgi:hypothetical protein